MKKLAIVIPAYKESENLIPLCKAITATYPASEILIVDDSPDEKSVKLIEEFGDKTVSIIHRREKGGRGSAVIAGISVLLKREFDFYLEMDADFSHQPSEIPVLITKAQSCTLDLLIGSRYLNGSEILHWPLNRRIFSKFANKVARYLLKVPVTDYTNGFRLYSPAAAKVVVNDCGRLGTGFIALSETLVNIYYRDLKVGEIETKFINRMRGESSLSFNEIWSAFRGLFKIYKLKRSLKK